MTAAKVLVSALKYKITVFSGKNPGQCFVFDKPVVTVGRDAENDLVFANDPRMSRSHLEIRLTNGFLYAKNVSQKNHLLVNNERVDEKQLDGPAFIQVGETLLQVQWEQSAEAPPAPPPPARPAPLPPASSSRYQELKSLVTPDPSAVSIPMPSQTAAQVAPAYQAPPSYPSQAAAMPSMKRAASPASQDGSRTRFYAIIIFVGLGLVWVWNDNAKKKQEVNIRTEGDVARAIEESARAVQEIQKKQSSAGLDTIQYRASQEHYIRGFRDYRQGQYARAMQSFSAALSFYPAHELARKYYTQSARKFEAQIDFAMSQGRKYYQKNNFKMCQSSFASVMVMLKDSSKQKYKEAKQFYDECRLRQEDRI